MRNSTCGLPVCIAQSPTTDDEKNARAEYPTVHGVETEIRSTLLFAFVAEQDGCDQESCDREEHIDARPTHSEDVIDDRHPRWSIVDPDNGQNRETPQRIQFWNPFHRSGHAIAAPM